MSKLLYTDTDYMRVQLNNPVKFRKPTPIFLHIYNDRIEVEYWSVNKDLSIKKCLKKFNYQDLYLMNETLNKIMNPKE